MANIINNNQEATYDPRNPAGSAIDSILGTGLTMINPMFGAAYNVGSGLFKAIRYPFAKKKAEEMSGQREVYTEASGINLLGGRERGQGTEFTTTELTTDYEAAKPWADISRNALGAAGGVLSSKFGVNGLGDKLDEIFGRKDSILGMNKIGDTGILNPNPPVVPDSKLFPGDTDNNFNISSGVREVSKGDAIKEALNYVRSGNNPLIK